QGCRAGGKNDEPSIGESPCRDFISVEKARLLASRIGGKHETRAMRSGRQAMPGKVNECCVLHRHREACLRGSVLTQDDGPSVERSDCLDFLSGFGKWG